MIMDRIEEFAQALPATGALIGLDLGTKTIGVAISDGLRSVATPVETIKRAKFNLDRQQLEVHINTRDIKGLILGLPRNMDGSEGPRCQSTRAFARNLSSHITIPIGFWDERLSTSAVQRFLINDADITRKQRKKIIDKLAAAYILQGAIDSISR